MGVEEARHHRMPLQIDPLRPRSCLACECGGGADRRDAAIPDRQRFGNARRAVERDDGT
jgi:hypothetical protein